MSRHLFTTCAALGALFAGAALASGCAADSQGDDPAPLPPTPTPTPTPPPPQPPPPPPQPPLPPPPPPVVIAPQDGLDPVKGRMLYANSQGSALMGFYLDTGVQEIVFDSWPWPDTESVYLREFALDHSGKHVYQYLSRTYVDPEEPDGGCVSKELVRLNLEDETLETLQVFDRGCCDDCGDGFAHRSPVFDPIAGMLRYVYESCDPNYCDTYLQSSPPTGTEPMTSQLLYHDYCATFPDEDDSSYCADPDMLMSSPGRALVVDPRAPSERSLVLTADLELVSIDHMTDDVELISSIQSRWGEINIEAASTMLLDIADERVFVVANAGTGLGPAVVATDINTGSQRLLYAGERLDDGSIIGCISQAAFDAQGQRILLRANGFCDGEAGIYAIDPSTGVATRL